MRATAWHNGAEPRKASGYGLKVSERDRDRYFDRDWDRVVLQLPGGISTEVTLSASFWSRCSELRSAAIGRWLLDSAVAAWPKGFPPGISLAPMGGSDFSAELIARRTIGALGTVT
jgi:hypothetical protein